MQLFGQDVEMCSQCYCILSHNAKFCGKCGHKITDEFRQDEHDDTQPAQHRKPRQSNWERLLPALKLWIYGVVFFGVVGIFQRFEVFPIPWTILCAYLIVLVYMGLVYFRSAHELRPLLAEVGMGGTRLLEAAMALAFLVAFMWAYILFFEFLSIQYYNPANDFGKAGWPVWATILSLSLLPAITEEFAFRGFIQFKLEKVCSKNEALVIQAAMFSFLHFLPTMFISHFFMGLVFGVLRNRTRSLYPCMLVHALWNVISMYS